MAIEPKKYNGFTGVFTPSILTILGVIMYLRLGWVVGQAGLYAAIGIILIAHVISITTGLSISSISTDKKIRTGGIYYILSRSLGLPMGGAIGITLFVGTALSISLYIVGFAENFLSIDAIRELFGLELGIDSIRIIGTIVISLLAVIALISTSLAMKMQYVVLSAIAISLISVLGGVFFDSSVHSVNLAVTPMSDISLEVVFGVFFPAVTGFTVGVSMSGDLKDPNHSIPRGTMGSIIVGMVVYLVLAIAFGVFLDRDMLINDSNFLMKVALYSPLVIAGIWGATLSSALGGILGAPRILQAIAQDRLVPKIFKVGYGPNNEPRNALIFTFLIAEAGILIGDLNIIAGIVTMFFIAAYGFINLAYALEKWASSDFRPSFSIPVWVGIVGAFASFAVMFKLDTLAMFAALLIMFAIYATLKRKQIQLDLGDVWQSVWSTLVRDSLHRMNLRQLEPRNWRPNIVLFSGNQGLRGHLIDFGKALVGQHGFLSDFELIEQRDKNTILPKTQQSVKTENAKRYTGVFNRKEYSDDIYSSIVSISKHYGFAGVEPNTVLLGWGRHSEEPVRFAKTIRQLTRLDMNIMMMDYDQDKGFGDRKRIDIWWRGSNNNGQLALSMVRFLWLSEGWRNAEVRMLIVNYNNDQKKQIERKAKDILDSMRLRATIKVINNAIEKRPFKEILHSESLNSDMTFLGIPEIADGKEKELVEGVNGLCQDIGTVVLVRASTTFKAIDLGVDSSPAKLKDRIEPIIKKGNPNVIPVDLKKEAFIFNSDSIYNELSDIAVYINEEILLRLFNYQDELVQYYKEEMAQLFDRLQKSEDVTADQINSSHDRLLQKLRNTFWDLKLKHTEIQKDLLGEGVTYVDNQLAALINNQQENHIIDRDINDYAENEQDSKNLKLYKKRVRKLHGKEQFVKENILFRKLIDKHLHQHQYKVLEQLLEQWGTVSIHFLVELMKLVDMGASSLKVLEHSKQRSLSDFQEESKKILEQADKLSHLNQDSYNEMCATFTADFLHVLNPIHDNLNKLRINSFIPKMATKTIQKEKERIQQIPLAWQKNQLLLFNMLYLEVSLYAFAERVRVIMNDTSLEIREAIKTNYNDVFDGLIHILRKKNVDGEELKEYLTTNQFTASRVKVEFGNIIETTLRKIRLAENIFPELLQLLSEDSYHNMTDKLFDQQDQLEVMIRQLADFIVQREIMSPLQERVTVTGNSFDQLSAKALDIINRMSGYLADEKEEGMVVGNSNHREIHELTDQLEEELIRVGEYTQRLNAQIDEVNNSLESSLTVEVFIGNVDVMRQYVRELEKKQRVNQIRKYVEIGQHEVRKILNFVLFYQSKRKVTHLVDQHAGERPARVEDILRIRSAKAPDPVKLQKLPFFYQQLYTRKQYYLNDFWVGRQDELLEAKSAWSDQKSGFEGALLVVGERYAGKSFFSQYAAKQIVPNAKAYTVYAPYSGSVSTAMFKSHIQKATNVFGSYDEIFNTIPEQSVLIIDDLELWWEMGETKVIDQLLYLIENYSSKCFFIINLNLDSFKEIAGYKAFDSYFLRIIDLKPFDAEGLKQIVLKRHQASGMNIRLAESNAAKVSSWQYAKVFNKIFELSKGNAGIALRTWISNLELLDDKTLQIAVPVERQVNEKLKLDKEWDELVRIFLLHKRVTIQRLMRLFNESQTKVMKKINKLKRSGLIVEQSAGVYEIDPYLYHTIREVLETEKTD